MAGNSQMPRTAKSRAGARPHFGRTQGRNGSAPSGGRKIPSRIEIATAHAGYAVRRFQIWIFQDFIRTLAAVHLATAELLGEAPPLVTIVTRDGRVRENAEALGYTVE